MKYILLSCMVFCFLYGCTRTDKFNIIGHFPVSIPFYIDLYNINTGEKVFSDSLNTNDFNLSIASFPKGLYQAVFSWERDLLRPQEIERFTRQPELGKPKYFLSTTFWFDNVEANEYSLSFDSVYRQDELEEILFNQEVGEPTHMWIKSHGSNNKLYNQYLELIDSFKRKNQQQKDSLQQSASHYNEHERYDEANIISQSLSTPWLDHVKDELINQEILFMQKNIHSAVIVQIYDFQVNSKQDFERYIKVYNSFPTHIKQDVKKHLSNFTN